MYENDTMCYSSYILQKGENEIRLFHFVIDVIYSKLFTIGILVDEDVI